MLNALRRITHHRKGTSLVEVLVVIVIFLIGILAIAQIFPGGFRVLANTRAISVASTLAESELNRVQASGQMPEMVIPILYQPAGGTTVVIADPNRTEDDLGPQGQSIGLVTDASGDHYDLFDGNGNDLGRWAYLSGANNVRRIVGEGRVVPPPRIIGSDRGGLFLLEFAPIVYNTNASYLNLFVYGNDMERTMGNPEPVAQGTIVLPFRYFLDDSTPGDPVLYIPQDASRAHNMKLSLTAYINISPVQVLQRSYVALPPISVGGTGSPDPYQAVHVAPLITGPGETLNSIDPGSVKLARVYDQVGSFSNDPYQYKLLDQSLGIILVNANAFNVIQRTSTGREVPLEVRADYDVYDWRILKEDFRVPDSGPYEYRLRLANIKHRNGYEADNKPFLGLNVKVLDESGSNTLEQRDIIIMDLQTGGLYSKRAFTINYSTGVITFKDSDNNPANGLQTGLIFPGNLNPTIVNAAGRSVRIFYMANGEWAAQLLKAPEEYTFTQSAIPAPGACYVPSSGNLIRFPKADVNKTITIDELWYTGSDGQRHLAHGHAFVVQKDKSATPGNPFITVTDLDPGSQGLDFSNGFAVRGVKGTYVAVRSLYNLGSMNFTTDNVKNISVFETWLRGWNRTYSESALGEDDTP